MVTWKGEPVSDSMFISYVHPLLFETGKEYSPSCLYTLLDLFKGLKVMPASVVFPIVIVIDRLEDVWQKWTSTSMTFCIIIFLTRLGKGLIRIFKRSVFSGPWRKTILWQESRDSFSAAVDAALQRGRHAWKSVNCKRYRNRKAVSGLRITTMLCKYHVCLADRDAEYRWLAWQPKAVQRPLHPLLFSSTSSQR